MCNVIPLNYHYNYKKTAASDIIYLRVAGNFYETLHTSKYHFNNTLFC
jgi:hypothetical protein